MEPRMRTRKPRDVTPPFQTLATNECGEWMRQWQYRTGLPANQLST